MGRLSKEEVARFSGAEWMLRFVKEHGIEAGEKELDERGVRHLPLGVNKADLKKFEIYEKKNTIATVLIMACMTMRDEYGFGRKRLNRWINRFNGKTACLVDGYVNWKDLQRTLAEETGIWIPLPEAFMNDEEGM